MADTHADKNANAGTGGFQFELVSPERILVSEKAAMVVIPGEEGDFGVLPFHAPVLSSIRPGVVSVTGIDGTQKRIFVAGGFADVNDNHCALLAEEAVNVQDLDRAKLEEKLSNLHDDLNFAKDDAAKTAHIRKAIDVTKAKIAAIA